MSSSGVPPATGSSGAGCPGTVTYVCPSGYGCGLDSVCRKPKPIDTFETVATLASDTALDLFVADTNADGCADIVQETLQRTSIVSFDSAASGFCTASTQTLSKSPGQTLYASPLVAASPGGTETGLVSSGLGLLGPGIFLFSADRGAAQSPLFFAGLPIKEGGIRPLAVHAATNDWLVIVTGTAPTGNGMMPMLKLGVITDPRNQPSMSGLTLTGGGLDQIAVLQAVDVGGPCNRVVIGFYGQGSLHVYDVCDANGNLAFAAKPDIQIDGKLRASNPSLVVIDEDSDGHPDLVMNASDTMLHVAYGLGDGTFQSQPTSKGITRDQRTSSFAPPSGGEALVDAGNLIVAGTFGPSGRSIVAVGCNPGSSFSTELCASRMGAATVGACEVVVADIDDDGLDDVVVTLGQQPGIDVLRARKDGSGFHTSSIDTLCPAHDLAAGDFDDDGVGDVAYFDQAVTSSGDHVGALQIAYGNAFAAPGGPVAGGHLVIPSGLAAGMFVNTGHAPQLFAASGLGAQNGGAPSSSAVALLEGHEGRVMLAPYYFPTGSGAPGSLHLLDASLYAVAEGRFGSTFRTLAAVAQDATNCSAAPLLWWITLDTTNGVTQLPATIDPGIHDLTGVVLTQVDVDGDGTDELMLLADGSLSLYAAGASTAIRTVPTRYRYTSVDASSPPNRYVPRPLVGDLDGDGAQDVVVREQGGALIAFWGDRTNKTFTEQQLVAPPVCADAGAGSSSSSASSSSGSTSCGPNFAAQGAARSCAGQSFALLNRGADWSTGKRLLVVGPGILDLYTLDGRTAMRTDPPQGSTLHPPMSGTDFTAVGAGDLDGDGVDDLVMMADSRTVQVLRGVPVLP